MKKDSFSSFRKVAAVALVLIGLVFAGCEKEELTTNPEQQITVDNTLNKILNFKNLVENPQNIKSGEVMSVDSAVWYIEALLNYEYCIIYDSTQMYNEFAKDSILMNICIENNQINLQEIVNAFCEFENLMIEKLKKIDSENKRVNLVDVKYTENGFMAYISFNYGESIFNSKTLWSITDDWYWGYTLNTPPWRAGKCDGTCQGRDAVTEINRWIAYRTAIPVGVYYTDVHFVGLFTTASESNPNGTNLSSYGIDMFSFETDQIDVQTTDQWTIATFVCLTASECNYYAQQCKNALTVIENNFINENEDITYALLNGHIWRRNASTPPTNLYHMYFIKAGTRHYANPSEL